VQPFGNSLVTMSLTAARLKDLLEQQFPGCGGQTTQRLLQPSQGLRIVWDAAAPACRKIVELRFTPTDATVFPPAATGPEQAIVSGGALVGDAGRRFRITVNSFLAGGGDAFTVLAEGGERLGGAQDLDALAAYLGRFRSEPYDPRHPTLAAPRITRLP
jgi:5'-nucleotidase